MKPSSFLSAKSKKIGNFLHLSTDRKANSNSEASNKNDANEKVDKNGQICTPKTKPVTGFSLNNPNGLLGGFGGRVE